MGKKKFRAQVKLCRTNCMSLIEDKHSVKEKIRKGICPSYEGRYCKCAKPGQKFLRPFMITRSRRSVRKDQLI